MDVVLDDRLMQIFHRGVPVATHARKDVEMNPPGLVADPLLDTGAGDVTGSIRGLMEKDPDYQAFFFVW